MACFPEADFQGVWAAHFYGTGVLRQSDSEQFNFRVTDSGALSVVPETESE